MALFDDDDDLFGSLLADPATVFNTHSVQQQTISMHNNLNSMHQQQQQQIHSFDNFDFDWASSIIPDTLFPTQHLQQQQIQQSDNFANLALFDDIFPEIIGHGTASGSRDMSLPFDHQQQVQEYGQGKYYYQGVGVASGTKYEPLFQQQELESYFANEVDVGDAGRMSRSNGNVRMKRDFSSNSAVSSFDAHFDSKFRQLESIGAKGIIKEEDYEVDVFGSESDDGHESGRARAKRAGSPNAEAIRERNREAVRNCRKRKRELAVELEEKIAAVRKENAKLRSLLELGTDESVAQLWKSEERIVMLGDIEKWKNEHWELLDDRNRSLHHVLSTLSHFALPSHVTKMYLWQNAQPEEYFTITDGLWAEMTVKLGLTEEQQTKLKNRKNEVMKVCREIAAVVEHMDKFANVVERVTAKRSEGDWLKKFISSLNEEQIDKLLVMAHREVGRETIDAGFGKWLSSFNAEIEKELKTGAFLLNCDKADEVKRVDLKKFGATIGERDNVGGDNSLRNSRQRNALRFEEILSNGENIDPVSGCTDFNTDCSRMHEIFGQIFSPQCEMFDPNFRKPIKGIPGIAMYIRRFKSAFKQLKAELEEFSLKSGSNVAKTRWNISGVYRGTKNFMYLGEASETQVKFCIVIACKFVPESNLMDQLVISWAAINLLGQLGLISKLGSLGTSSAVQQVTKNPPPTVTKPALSTEAEPTIANTTSRGKKVPLSLSIPKVNVLKLAKNESPKYTTKLLQDKCLLFTKVFETENSDERSRLMEQLLDEDCAVVDSNMGGCFQGRQGCQKYVDKMRRPFRELQLTKHNFIPIKPPTASATLTQHHYFTSKYKKAAEIDVTTLIKVQMGCLIKGFYEGALVNEPRPFSFSAEMFFVFSTTTGYICEVVLNWNATSLMSEIGVIKT